MKKRVLALLLSVIFCIGLISTASADAELGGDGDSTEIIEGGSGFGGGGDSDPGNTDEPDPGNTDEPDPGNTDEPDPGNTDPPQSSNPPVIPPDSSGSDDYEDYDYTPTPAPSSAPSYDVSGSGTAAGGSWSTDKASAKKGDTVTITVKPLEGQQGTPAVTDQNGASVPVASLGSNKYSFVMPDGKVTVSVAFTPIPTGNPFVDVKESDYFYDAIQWAVKQGITNGTNMTSFSPEATCTRAETVTFLWRAAGSPKPASTGNPFTDVTSNSYYFDAVLWALEQGITKGTTATTFGPNDTVTRGQTVTFLYRASKAQPMTGSNPFTDVNAGEYYADAVQWAVNRGITKGTSASTFGPAEGCTRGQIVTFLYRAK